MFLLFIKGNYTENINNICSVNNIFMINDLYMYLF